MDKLREKFENAFFRVSYVLRSERGQGLVEYGLLLVLIAVVVILMLRGTGEQVNNLYTRINSGLNQ